MITVTLPDWFTWLLVLIIGLQTVLTLAQIYIKWLERKILKAGGKLK